MKTKKKQKFNLTPNPGSEEAIKLGCSCPCMDNNYGINGSYYGEGKWIIMADCPIHNKRINKFR